MMLYMFYWKWVLASGKYYNGSRKTKLIKEGSIVTSYSTKATWLMVRELAPFGKFYIYSYFIIVFLSATSSILLKENYTGFFIWSQTINSSTIVKITHDVIIFYLIFSYIFILIKYFSTNLDCSTKEMVCLSYEEFFDKMEIYQGLSSTQYRFVLSLLSILSLSVSLLMLHLFTMNHGGAHTRVGNMFSGSSIKAILYTSLINLAMFFVFIYSFVVWEQKNYVSK